MNLLLLGWSRAMTELPFYCSSPREERATNSHVSIAAAAAAAAGDSPSLSHDVTAYR